MGKNQLEENTEERGKGLVLILVKFCNVWTPYSVHSMVQYARIFFCELRSTFLSSLIGEEKSEQWANFPLILYVKPFKDEYIIPQFFSF